MGGGAAMRAAGKLAGVVNGSFRGGIAAVPLPEHISSGASKGRPIAGGLTSSSFDDWEMGESEEAMPMARLVFGGAPTLEEARDATFQLRTALDQAYLSNKSSGGPFVSYPENHLETKACVTSDTSASERNHAIQAFHLLNESTAAQTVVASIASDPNVWTAVLQNDALVEFLHSQKTGVNGSWEKSTAGAEYSGYNFPKQSGNEMFHEETEPRTESSNFFQDVKVRLEEMMDKLSSFFQNLFVGPGAGDQAVDGSAKATSVDKAMGASFMGLAIMVIIIAILRRG